MTQRAIIRHPAICTPHSAPVIPHPTHKIGLTLVELIVVMVLLLFIGLAVAGLVRSVRDAEQRIEQISETNQIGRVALRRLTAELSSAFPLPVPVAEAGIPLEGTEEVSAEETASTVLSFYHEDSYDTRLGIDLDTLRFTTASADPRRGETPQTELQEVFYFVDTDPQTPEKGLVRVVGTLPGLLSEDASPEQMPSEILSPRVVSLNFRFYDPDAGEWLETWEMTDVLPPLVEITVGVAPFDGDDFLSLLDRDQAWLERMEWFTATVPIRIRSYPDPSIQQQGTQQPSPLTGQTMSIPSPTSPQPSPQPPTSPRPPTGTRPQGGGQQ